jgi:hypothetical protein
MDRMRVTLEQFGDAMERCGALIELAKQFHVGHFYDHGKPHANDRIVSVAGPRSRR